MVGRLGRYKDLAWFVAKYGRADFVTEPVNGEEAASSDPTIAAAFAKDLESLGPTFIKLGQILSTRADLLPQAYLEALARLQDQVDPFPYADVERTIREELGVRMTALVMGTVLVANLGLVVAEFAGIGAAAELFGVTRYAVVPGMALRQAVSQYFEALAAVARACDDEFAVDREARPVG